MKVLAHEPYPDRDFVAEHGVELVSLNELLQRSDFISLHLPVTPETRHVIDAESPSQMKRSAYLVNTARGPLIDEAALEAALEAGQLAGAGLDVREKEPPGDTRFTRFDNVILTTHIAGVTEETLDAMGKMACKSAADALAGIDSSTLSDSQRQGLAGRTSPVGTHVPRPAGVARLTRTMAGRRR